MDVISSVKQFNSNYIHHIGMLGMVYVYNLELEIY